jgi:hypothetical protein
MEKEQPWKRLFQAQDTGSATTVVENGTAKATPWQGWAPDPARPDEKPWIQWMNDPHFQGKALMKQAGNDLKQRQRQREREAERGRERERKHKPSPRHQTLSPQGTVAEGG